jgi:hypothetical protein
MLRKLPKITAGTRDKAMLLIEFSGAFRRCEIVARSTYRTSRSRRRAWRSA